MALRAAGSDPVNSGQSWLQDPKKRDACVMLLPPEKENQLKLPGLYSAEAGWSWNVSPLDEKRVTLRCVPWQHGILSWHQFSTTGCLKSHENAFGDDDVLWGRVPRNPSRRAFTEASQEQSGAQFSPEARGARGLNLEWRMIARLVGSGGTDGSPGPPDPEVGFESCGRSCFSRKCAPRWIRGIFLKSLSPLSHTACASAYTHHRAPHWVSPVRRG